MGTSYEAHPATHQNLIHSDNYGGSSTIALIPILSLVAANAPVFDKNRDGNISGVGEALFVLSTTAGALYEIGRGCIIRALHEPKK
jgi:hypothetical protein